LRLPVTAAFSRSTPDRPFGTVVRRLREQSPVRVQRPAMGDRTPLVEHLGLRHVALNVSDVERAVVFYRDLLGFRVVWEPDPDNIYLSSGCDSLAIHRADEVRRPGALDHIGVVVRRPGDVERAEVALREAGVTILQEVKVHRDQSVSCYVADPDGNSVQVLFDPDISKLGLAEGG
jgi:catechol 2,3-dioxygenase-like lactoylglutathione lyase family enzyme